MSRPTVESVLNDFEALEAPDKIEVLASLPHVLSNSYRVKISCVPIGADKTPLEQIMEEHGF